MTKLKILNVKDQIMKLNCDNTCNTTKILSWGFKEEFDESTTWWDVQTAAFCNLAMFKL